MPQIPAGWKETTLGEVLILNYGKGLTVEKRINGTIPVYWSSWITGYHNQELVWWPWIIIWRKWSVGKVYFSKQSFYPIDTVYYILPDKNYDLIFIYNLLLTLGLDKMNSDSAVPWLNRDNAYALPIHLPPLPEQQAIAAVLSSFDDKIELLRAENQTLEQMGQELFKERFGKWKVGDELPQGWRVGKLGEMGTIICWKTPSKNNWDFFWWNIPFIKIPDMHWNLFILKTEDSLTEEGADSQKNKYISEWAICVSCIATVGLVSLTTKSSQTNQQINSITPKFDDYREYLYYSLVWMKNELLAIGAWWSATLNINTTTFSNISIIIPDQETLSKFDLVIKPLFNKIRANSEQIQTLSATCDQLLPKLMSWEMRVEF